MTSQNPTPPVDPLVPDEALVHLGKVVAEVLASNKAFISNVVSLAVEASVKSVADSAQRQRQELEAYAASLTQGNVAPGGTVATATEKRTPKTNEEWRDAILFGIYQFVQNPVDNLNKVADLVQKIRRPTLDPAGLKGIPLAQIKLLAKAQPDEYAFVYQQEFPDQMGQIIPPLMEDAYKKGGLAVMEANKWLRALIRQEALAERRSNASSSTSTLTPSSPSATEQPAHDGAGGHAPRPATPLAGMVQNPKPSDWKRNL